MHVSSRKVASSVCQALAEDMPRGFMLTLTGSTVHLSYQGDELGASTAAKIVDEEDGRPIEQRLLTACTAVLSAVQDWVSEQTGEEWPTRNVATGAMPGADIDPELMNVRLWFGPSWSHAALALKPIPLSLLY